MHIEFLKNIDELPRIKEPWQTLCDELKDDISPFSSYEWHELWWKYYSAGESLCMMIMWGADKLVGIAPLMLRRATIHGLPLTVVCFLENNQSFFNDFIVLPEFRDKFFQQILSSLFYGAGSQPWHAVVLNKLSTVSPNYRSLIKILDATGRKWREEQTIDARYIIPSGSWEEFFSSRSSRSRSTLRHIHNRMRKTGDVSVRHITTWEEFEKIHEEFYHVARSSWSEKIGDSMASPANVSFFNELARSAAAKGWLSVWILSLDGRMIATEFHLRAYGKEYAMRGHYLPEYAGLSPGTYLEMQIIKNVFEEKDRLRKYDLGYYYDYKRKWAENSEPHMTLFVFNDSLYSRFVSFQERKVIPFLRKMFPQQFWEHKFFKICGIDTSPFKIRQH